MNKKEILDKKFEVLKQLLETSKEELMITNDNLKEFLQAILNKPIEKISVEDLSNVKAVRISTSDSEGNHIHSLLDLQNFNNLEKVVISNSLIKDSEIDILARIHTLIAIEFEHSAFEDERLISKLNKIQSLSFDNCFIKDYAFLNSMANLNEFVVRNPYDETPIDLSLLNSNSQLNILHLECCMLNNLNTLSLPSLEEIFLLKTSLDDLSFIERCPKLSRAYIEERYLNDIIVKNNAERILFKTNILDLVTAEDASISL